MQDALGSFRHFDGGLPGYWPAIGPSIPKTETTHRSNCGRTTTSSVRDGGLRRNDLRVRRKS